MSRRKSTYAGGDPRTRAARERGYPARSVFKLEEIDARIRLFRPGQRVLDLGAAPGSWTLFAGERVGPGGEVVAVDLQQIVQPLPSNAIVLQGDVLALGAELAARGPFDVVLSDMAPSTSGSKVRDQAMSFELFSEALGLARACGRRGSRFVGKLFMGPDFAQARSAVVDAYRRCVVIRPAGTRQQSSEVFLVGEALISPNPGT